MKVQLADAVIADEIENKGLAAVLLG
jgi:hypothetical protein